MAASSAVIFMNASHLHPSFDWLSIGSHFQVADREFRVTDLGTRTIIAVRITEKEKADPSWLNGPPYAIAELVFDEDDFEVIEPLATD
jgi:hypothetical protein